jgi:hypothetical protein
MQNNSETNQHLKNQNKILIETIQQQQTYINQLERQLQNKRPHSPTPEQNYEINTKVFCIPSEQLQQKLQQTSTSIETQAENSLVPSNSFLPIEPLEQIETLQILNPSQPPSSFIDDTEYYTDIEERLQDFTNE